MTTRADRITQVSKTPELFSDFLDDLVPHPVTGDVARIKNEQSIRQALKNIVLTNYGERPFQSYIGSNVTRSLFEMNDDITAESIRAHVDVAIKNCEPRVNLINVDVTSFPMEDKMAVNIVFAIVNSTALQNINLILRRVR